jgi:alpha-beta hydrolase superfamily lysophospholipase
LSRLIKWIITVVVLVLVLSAFAGYWAASMSLHPERRPLSAKLIAEADAVFQRDHAARTSFDVRAQDGILLRGWLAQPTSPLMSELPTISTTARANGDWVLLFHGVADNRVGDLGVADFLLRAGYRVVMMDSRAHGESEGDLATYGWKERDDARAIVAALENKAHPRCIFAFGVSMGGGISLQAAAVEPRIVAVAAEAPFSSFREASYDYAGLHRNPWLGRILFRTVVEMGFFATKKMAGFYASDVSPENSVSQRPFPILLISDGDDVVLPLRHQQNIFAAAKGPKEIWIVPGAIHASAMGVEPEEYERRVLAFFAKAHDACPDAKR